MGCRDTIGGRCGKKTSAKCIDYEGTLVTGTTITDPCNKDLENVIKDINAQINKLVIANTLTGLTEECIKYNPAGSIITVKEAILGLNAKVCELVDITKLNTPEVCPTCTTDCASDTCTSNGLIYYSFAAGSFPLSVIGTWASGVTLTDPYSTNLQHVVPSTGKYKVTVELDGTMATSSTARVGVSINGAVPIETNNIVGYFSSALIKEEVAANTTFTFVQDLTKGDSISIKVKLVSGTLYTVNSTKLITEKIG